MIETVFTLEDEPTTETPATPEEGGTEEGGMEEGGTEEAQPMGFLEDAPAEAEESAEEGA